MIPENKKSAVTHALQVAFGVSEFEAINQLMAGLSSALIFRIVVKGNPYLLRIITRTDPMGDPTHYYGCMKIAANAGLAPHIWYADIPDRISITDFITAKPFPLKEAKLLMADMLKRLHALPCFPRRLNYLDFANGSIRKFQAAKIIPESMTEELIRQYDRIMQIYPRNEEDLVSCHNDLKPDNVLFDGERVWLVDWEAAFLNDRYTELAVVANFVLTDDQDEMGYLKRYFGDDFNAYHRARFFLMQQVMHMVYLSFFMRLSIAGDLPLDFTKARPEFREFHNRLWEGKINLLNHEAQQEYAWVHLDRVKHNLKLKRFEDSLQIVSKHQ